MASQYRTTGYMEGGGGGGGGQGCGGGRGGGGGYLSGTHSSTHACI